MFLGVCKAHFTLGVKVKVKFKSSIPVGAITEISECQGLYNKSRG